MKIMMETPVINPGQSASTFVDTPSIQESPTSGLRQPESKKTVIESYYFSSHSRSPRKTLEVEDKIELEILEDQLIVNHQSVDREGEDQIETESVEKLVNENLLSKADNFMSLEELSLNSKDNNQSQSDSKSIIMGNGQSGKSGQTQARNIISEVPQSLEARKRVNESTSSGNCRVWSDNVYYKLFLDPQGRNAKLMVLKCEITFVDIFSDEEICLYKGRFIGAKADGVARLFVFDLMKSQWEEKLPKSQAVELNVDIVMSSSPIHQCCETLMNLLQLEKRYLKHLSFDGQLNITLRFAHSYAWDVKDDTTRRRIHQGLRDLYQEGVNLEVMSAENIQEEMKIDGIENLNNEKVNFYLKKRREWKFPGQPNTGLSEVDETKSLSEDGVGQSDYSETSHQKATSVRSSSKSLVLSLDCYNSWMNAELWNILHDAKRIINALDEVLSDREN